MAELEELEQEELNKKMTNTRLPNVPSTSLPAQPARMPSRIPSTASTAHRAQAGLFPTSGTCQGVAKNSSQAYPFWHLFLIF